MSAILILFIAAITFPFWLPFAVLLFVGAYLVLAMLCILISSIFVLPVQIVAETIKSLRK